MSASVDQAPVLVRRPPGSENLPNRMSPSCLGEPRLKGSPASLWLSASSRAMSFAKSLESFRRNDGRDHGPGSLHGGEDGNERPLQSLVDGQAAFGDEARLEHKSKSQRDVGLFGGVARRLGQRHLVERHAVAALADEVGKRDRLVLEMKLRELGKPVSVDAGIEHIGHQHRIVARLEADAALKQHHGGEFQIVPDLQDRTRLRAAARAAESA